MHRTCAPYRFPWEMPTHRWLARFLCSYWRSLLGLFWRRFRVFVTHPPLNEIRFDVYGGTSVYEARLISLAETMPHLAFEKRIGITSHLANRRHAILLDWDHVAREQLDAWLRHTGGRWHLYRTEQGFHFICSSRVVSYWELVRLIHRARFQPRGGLNVILLTGHAGLRISRKERSGPDIFKIGVGGEGEEVPEVRALIDLHDELLERFHGAAAAD